MPSALWSAYPKLRETLASLAGGRTWCLTGVSAVLLDGPDLLLEITKPSHWVRTADGRLRIGIGAVGGSLEPGETVLECLAREADEEIGVGLTIDSAPRTFFVHEEQHVLQVAGERSPAYPRPALLTVSRNLHRRSALPECEVLAIVTFLARPCGAGSPRDLFGLLRLPASALAGLLATPHTAGQVLDLPAVRADVHGTLPRDALLEPVWTVRSLQILHAAGRLADLLPPT